MEQFGQKQGDIIASAGTVTLNCTGYGSVAAQISGTFVGTITWQGTVDNSNWVNINAVTPTGTIAITATGTGIYLINSSGFSQIRGNCTAYTSGTISIFLQCIADSGVPTNATAVSVTADTEFPTATAAANDYANPTTTDVKSFGMLFDGSTWDRALGDSVNGALVSGNLAHDAVDSGNPLKTGGQARTTNPIAVADADRVNFISDKLGKQVVVSCIRDLKGQQKTTITSSTSETTIVTAVASTFLDLYGLIISNTSATACNVTIKDSTAGTTRAIIAVPAGDVRGFMLGADAAIPQATVNTAWTATCSASVASIEITALYVKNI